MIFFQSKDCFVFVRRFALIVLWTFFCLFAANGQAQDEDEELTTTKVLPRVNAIQSRPHNLTREFGIGLSFLPSDHFNQYYGLSASYSLYFGDNWGWELMNFTYLANQSTGLREKLIATYSALPETTDIIKYQATTNVFYTPLFQKHLVKNKEVMWGDLTLIGGAGLVNLDREGFQTVFDVGGAVRFFQGENWIYRLDLRQYFYLTSAVKPNMGITLGMSYNFGGIQK